MGDEPQRVSMKLVLVVIIGLLVLLTQNSGEVITINTSNADVHNLKAISNLSASMAVEEGTCVNPGPDIWATLSIDQRIAYALGCINATTP